MKNVIYLVLMFTLAPALASSAKWTPSVGDFTVQTTLCIYPDGRRFSFDSKRELVAFSNGMFTLVDTTVFPPGYIYRDKEAVSRREELVSAQALVDRTKSRLMKKCASSELGDAKIVRVDTILGRIKACRVDVNRGHLNFTYWAADNFPLLDNDGIFRFDRFNQSCSSGVARIHVEKL